MEFNRDLIARLRNMASQGASIRMMVNEIRCHLGTNDGLPLVSDAYFRKAFLLPLGQIRDMEGSTCLGGKSYSDGEIDRLMLPRIASTRPLWEGKKE